MVHFINDPPRYSFSSSPRYSQIFFDKISSITGSSATFNSVNRLEMQHYIFKYLWKTNFSTPILKQLQAGGAKVLEVGSSPEIWTFDMANHYPLSTFIGLNTTCTNKSTKINEPLNATVLQANSSSSTIPFPDETFDFIYQRFFLPQLNTNANSALNSDPIFVDQYNLIKDMIRVLNPGGWLEFMIIDNLCWYNSGLYTFRLTQAYYSLTNKNGYDYSKVDEKNVYNMLMSTQQIKSIVIDTKRTLLGSNGGRIGELLCDVLLHPIKSNKTALCKHMRVSPKEFDEMYNTMLQEINDYETFCVSHRIYAKKS